MGRRFCVLLFRVERVMGKLPEERMKERLLAASWCATVLYAMTGRFFALRSDRSGFWLVERSSSFFKREQEAQRVAQRSRMRTVDLAVVRFSLFASHCRPESTVTQCSGHMTKNANNDPPSANKSNESSSPRRFRPPGRRKGKFPGFFAEIAWTARRHHHRGSRNQSAASPSRRVLNG